MLVLARRVGERILIGDDVVVTVLEMTRDQVRIGIHAPRSLSVHREEVYQEILLANLEASDQTPPGVEQGTFTTALPPAAERPAKRRS